MWRTGKENAKQTFYELGSKATQILARRLRTQRTKHSIPKIRDLSTNEFTFDPEMIQTIFKSAYEMLCSTPTDSNVTEIQNYLFKLDLPTTDTNLSEALTSMKELDNVSKLKANKSPGSDGAFPLTGHLRLLSSPQGRCHPSNPKRRQKQRLLWDYCSLL